jgi:monoamine oxidase
VDVDVDVVVVGAGIAGLRAADRLVAAGLDVRVLEARDRVGGRMENGPLPPETGAADGTVVELGGQWIGPTQDRMYELVEDLGLEVFETYNEGQHLLHFGGRTRRVASHRGAVPKLSPFALADLLQAGVRLERLARRIPLDAPWEADGARALDGRTFESWLQANVRTATARRFLRLVCEALFSTESTDLSLLHVLFYVHSGTDLETLISVDRGAQQHRIVGGSVRIAEALAVRLGDRVQLRTPVRRVRHRDAGAGGGGTEVAVATDEGDVVTARRAILTLPPTLAGRLVYEPALPSWRDQLTQRVPAGSIIKVHAVYDRPFWRDEGLTGQAVADVGPVKLTFDNSPPAGTPGVLMGFAEGQDGRRLARLPPAERRALVLGCLGRSFGPRASRPTAYLERDWMAEEYTRGCYGGHFTPGVLTAFGHALRPPIGPLHWAGAETSDVWNGYLEGAVRSADRATSEVLAALR